MFSTLFWNLKFGSGPGHRVTWYKGGISRLPVAEMSWWKKSKKKSEQLLFSIQFLNPKYWLTLWHPFAVVFLRHKINHYHFPGIIISLAYKQDYSCLAVYMLNNFNLLLRQLAYYSIQYHKSVGDQWKTLKLHTMTSFILTNMIISKCRLSQICCICSLFKR